MTYLARLPDRALIAISGDERVEFLQGLVSNDVTLAKPGHAIWAALLTPQGKWFADFFIFDEDARYLLDVEAAQLVEIEKRLTRFRLRAKVVIQPDPGEVYAAWGGPPPDDAIFAPDPRLEAAGWRVLGNDLPTNATADEYDAHRLSLGLPDGSRDMEAEKSVLLEAGFDELGGVSWTKGCYMGQELTARTKYRGLVKRRLVPVRGESDLPGPGTPVLKDGVEMGTLRSARGKMGLALLRLEAIGQSLDCSGPIQTVIPPWMHLPPDPRG
jgi:folate-binding protein YgfZ